jgi:hypothetical protein
VRDPQYPRRAVQNHGGTGEDEQVVPDPGQVAASYAVAEVRPVGLLDVIGAGCSLPAATLDRGR